MISIRSLQKDFGNGKGVFNLTLDIPRGEVFGFLGPNGAGKTTTIRMLLGFIAPDSGECSIGGLPSFRKRAEIMETLGYLPAEINFFEGMTGIEFLKFIGSLHKLQSTDRRDQLIEYFGLDVKSSLSRMSKGMKQKTAIVAAFMSQPETLVLDEPTSGLDPLMQKKFNDLVISEKKKGTTIFMSSHNFEEIERTCDRAGILRQGHLVAIESIEKLHRNKQRKFTLTLSDEKDAKALLDECKYRKAECSGKTLTVYTEGDINTFIRTISGFDLTDIRSESISLEELFMQYYR